MSGMPPAPAPPPSFEKSVEVEVNREGVMMWISWDRYRLTDATEALASHALHTWHAAAHAAHTW